MVQGRQCPQPHEEIESSSEMKTGVEEKLVQTANSVMPPKLVTIFGNFRTVLVCESMFLREAE